MKWLFATWNEMVVGWLGELKSIMSFTRRDVDLNLGVYSILNLVCWSNCYRMRHRHVDKKARSTNAWKKSRWWTKTFPFFFSGSLLLLYPAIWSAYYRSLEIYSCGYWKVVGLSRPRICRHFSSLFIKWKELTGAPQPTKSNLGIRPTAWNDPNEIILP